MSRCSSPTLPLPSPQNVDLYEVGGRAEGLGEGLGLTEAWAARPFEPGCWEAEASPRCGGWRTAARDPVLLPSETAVLSEAKGPET